MPPFLLSAQPIAKFHSVPKVYCVGFGISVLNLPIPDDEMPSKVTKLIMHRISSAL